MGKLKPSVSDLLLEDLFRAVGDFLSWQRTRDPISKEAKRFGFATFNSPNALKLAIEHLNGIEIEGKISLQRTAQRRQNKDA